MAESSSSSFFLSKTVSKLRKETPRRLQELRDACDKVCSDKNLSDPRFAIDIGEFNAPLRLEVVQLYLHVFQQVCASRQSRLIEISLEGVNFLIEYGFFQVETSPSTSSSPSARQSTSSSPSARQESSLDVPIQTQTPTANLVDKYIELIGKFSDNEYDDVIQLQVIKTLLSSVNSTLCEVHEGSVLVAVRTCFHIHLMSKNTVNKNTAKAALTQMLSVSSQSSWTEGKTSSTS